MSKITIPSELSNQLRDQMNTVELCDESGKVLGRFSPQLDPDEYEGLEPQISEEELLRRERSTEKRYTTAEVLAHLEKLP